MNIHQNVVEIIDLHKSYGKFPALNGITFDVKSGEIFGIVGPNGAGKTTLVECLAGLRTSSSGKITVLGLDPQEQQRPLRQKIGIQLQQASLPDDIRVWEALDLFASFYPQAVDWKSLMEAWGLKEKVNARFASLSGGQKQRLFIALALVNDPELVILDELTTGLDPQARRATWDLVDQLRDAGKTVVIVTHSMEEVERLCDRVAIIDHGCLLALGTPQALVKELNAETRVLFSAPASVNWRELESIPGVRQVSREHQDVVVSGSGPLLARVASALAESGFVPTDLRSEQSTLEDVFLTLTGRKIREQG
jgi:ABC-2 type transport system ATP-binding protein